MNKNKTDEWNYPLFPNPHIGWIDIVGHIGQSI